MLQKLWNDECGGLLSLEFVLVATLMLGAVGVGMSAVNTALVTELGDLAAAIGALDQSYSVGGYTGHHASCNGQGYIDAPDGACDEGCAQLGDSSACIAVCLPKAGNGG